MFITKSSAIAECCSCRNWNACSVAKRNKYQDLGTKLSHAIDNFIIATGPEELTGIVLSLECNDFETRETTDD